MKGTVQGEYIKKSFKYIEVKGIRLDPEVPTVLLTVKQGGTGLHEQLKANSTFLLNLQAGCSYAWQNYSGNPAAAPRIQG